MKQSQQEKSNLEIILKIPRTHQIILVSGIPILHKFFENLSFGFFHRDNLRKNIILRVFSRFSYIRMHRCIIKSRKVLHRHMLVGQALQFAVGFSHQGLVLRFQCFSLLF